MKNSVCGGGVAHINKFFCGFALSALFVSTFGQVVSAQQPNYQPYTEARDSSTGSFLALSDVHLKGGAEYDCFNCETTEPLWRAARKKAGDIITANSVDFVMYLGDMPAHDQSTGPRGKDFGEVLDGLADIVSSSGVPLLYLPGNNDTIGPNYCGFDWKGTTVFDFAKTSKGDGWPIINGSSAPSSRASIIDGSHLDKGFYSARVTVGQVGAEQQLRVLALNTVVYTRKSDSSRCDQSSMTLEQRELSISRGASVQLDWVRDQLAAAETANEPVILAMHVPPGIDGFGGGNMWGRDLDYHGDKHSDRGRWLQEVFLERITAKSDVIVGVFSGHTHLNGIRRLRSCSNNFKELLISIPAISTDHGNFPSLKHITLGAGLEPIGADTYHAYDAPDFPWTPGKMFSFEDNYPNSTAPAGSTLFEIIDQVPERKLFGDMMSYLYAGAKSSPKSRSYAKAIDVTCGR